jgi:hypothetical protein
MAMKVRCWIVAVLIGFLPLTAHAQEEVKVTGRVVDADGKPVAGVEIASFWMAEGKRMRPIKAASTNAEGRFTLPVTFYGRADGLLALDRERKKGGLVLVDPKDANKPVEIELVPLVHVHGRFHCKELDVRPKWTMVYMMSGPARFLGCSSDEASFSFYLPPGKYKFWGYGTDIQNLKKDITLAAGKTELDMGTLDMAATIIARHKGKAPPAWHVSDARGVKKEVKLSDFKGKWVLLEFWGYW